MLAQAFRRCLSCDVRIEKFVGGCLARRDRRALPIQFGREVCGDLPAAERREWWVGNGLGAYAAGAIALTLTRRYAGWRLERARRGTARQGGWRGE